MSRNTSLKSNGKLAPFVIQQMQAVENKRKPCAMAHGPMTVSIPVRKRILEMTEEVVAAADIWGVELNVSLIVARRLHISMNVVNHVLWKQWFTQMRQENAALRMGIPLEALC